MPSKPGTLKIGSYLPAGEGSQVGAVRDESEHLREGKWRGEEGDAGGLSGTIRPVLSSHAEEQSPGEEEVLSALCTKEFRTTQFVSGCTLSFLAL